MDKAHLPDCWSILIHYLTSVKCNSAFLHTELAPSVFVKLHPHLPSSSHLTYFNLNLDTLLTTHACACSWPVSESEPSCFSSGCFLIQRWPTSVSDVPTLVIAEAIVNRLINPHCPFSVDTVCQWGSWLVEPCRGQSFVMRRWGTHMSERVHNAGQSLIVPKV